MYSPTFPFIHRMDMQCGSPLPYRYMFAQFINTMHCIATWLASSSTQQRPVRKASNLRLAYAFMHSLDRNAYRRHVVPKWGNISSHSLFSSLPPCSNIISMQLENMRNAATSRVWSGRVCNKFGLLLPLNESSSKYSFCNFSRNC